MGKVVVIEGTDYSGKTTQYELIKSRLEKDGEVLGVESFPVYESESSIFVRNYLKGDYGRDAAKINPKLASLFYGLDRYDSYKSRDWGKKYGAGHNILFARYTTSNILHQTSKLETKAERVEFINWLEDIEYNIMGIPKPDLVILLDMPPKVRAELKRKRDKEQGGLASSGEGVDIHELDTSHLDKSYYVAKEVADIQGWYIVSCVNELGVLRTIEDINNEIYAEIQKVYKK